MITINIEKAKKIHQDSIRKAREPLLAELDIKFQRSLETNKDTKQIIAQKQELRDLTNYPELIAAKTPEEIKAAWPEILGEKPF